MKAYGRVDVESHIFLTSVLVGGKWSASRPYRFTPGERAPPHSLDRRLGGPQSRSGRYGEEKILTLPGLELRPLAVQPVGSRYTDCATPAQSVVAQSRYYPSTCLEGVAKTAKTLKSG
jgi:hypothetical protein